MRRLLTLLVAVFSLVAPGIAGASTWDKPALVSPVTINLSTAAATVYNDSFKLSQSQDYQFICSTNPVQMPHWLTIWGGHNYTIEGCDFITQGGRALYLQNTNGTAWLHDLHFEAASGTQLTEGIDLQEPTPGSVVLRDVLIDELHGSYATNHADCIQTWSGPVKFMIDGFTCISDYQGLFLLPNQHDSTTVPTAWDFRNIDLTDNGYSFWVGNLNSESAIPTWNVQNVYANPLAVWDGTVGPCGCGHSWDNARSGHTPSGGHYVWATPGGAYGIDDPTPLALLPGE